MGEHTLSDRDAGLCSHQNGLAALVPMLGATTPKHNRLQILDLNEATKKTEDGGGDKIWINQGGNGQRKAWEREGEVTLLQTSFVLLLACEDDLLDWVARLALRRLCRKLGKGRGKLPSYRPPLFCS